MKLMRMNLIFISRSYPHKGSWTALTWSFPSWGSKYQQIRSPRKNCRSLSKASFSTYISPLVTAWKISRPDSLFNLLMKQQVMTSLSVNLQHKFSSTKEASIGFSSNLKRFAKKISGPNNLFIEISFQSWDYMRAKIQSESTRGTGLLSLFID